MTKLALIRIHIHTHTHTHSHTHTHRRAAKAALWKWKKEQQRQQSQVSNAPSDRTPVFNHLWANGVARGGAVGNALSAAKAAYRWHIAHSPTSSFQASVAALSRTHAHICSISSTKRYALFAHKSGKTLTKQKNKKEQQQHNSKRRTLFKIMICSAQ